MNTQTTPANLSLMSSGAIFHHPQLGKTFTRLIEIRDGSGDEQVADTIAWMSSFVESDSRCEAVEHALGLVRMLCAHSDEECVVRNIWYWVWSCCRFVEDTVLAEPYNNGRIVEVLIRPSEMLRLRRGDCDDFSMLVACLLSAAGIRWEFMTVAADPETPEEFSHVYVMAYPNSKPLALDASHGKYAGWQAPHVFRKQRWEAA